MPEDRDEETTTNDVAAGPASLGADVICDSPQAAESQSSAAKKALSRAEKRKAKEAERAAYMAKLAERIATTGSVNPPGLKMGRPIKKRRGPYNVPPKKVGRKPGQKDTKPRLKRADAVEQGKRLAAQAGIKPGEVRNPWGKLGKPENQEEIRNKRLMTFGYISIDRAYKLASLLDPKELVAMVEDGTHPKHKAWYGIRVTAQLQRAGRELMTTKGDAREINNRMDGKQADITLSADKLDPAEVVRRAHAAYVASKMIGSASAQLNEALDRAETAQDVIEITSKNDDQPLLGAESA